MKVTAILKGRIDQYGRQPIQIRVFSTQGRKFLPTHIKVEPTQFKKGFIMNHPQAKQFNDIIKRQVQQAEAYAILNKDKKKESRTELFEFIHRSLREWDKAKQDSTLRKYGSEVNKLKGFTGKILMRDCSTQWLIRYRNYLYQRNNQENTIWSTFKFVRLIFRKAFLEKEIENNPFDLFQMPKYKDPKKVYLSKQQLNSIEQFLQTDRATAEEMFAGYWFLISCYTGLRFGDLVSFSRTRNIKDDRIVLYTSKTDELVSMPFTERLQGYFEKVDYRALYYVNMHYNRLLKSIAAKVGITEKVSSHTARHTFATLAATVGISQEVTAKLLGHRSLKTTAIYYRIVDSRIDSEVAKMQL